jgi:hypothetical protein
MPLIDRSDSLLVVVDVQPGFTRRPPRTDAERAVAAAEKAGFKVHPQLKQDIKDRRKGT